MLLQVALLHRFLIVDNDASPNCPVYRLAVDGRSGSRKQCCPQEYCCLRFALVFSLEQTLVAYDEIRIKVD